MKKQLAKIKDARLSMDRNTFLTFWITLNYEGAGHQGFGGYCLDAYDDEKERRVGTAAGCEIIRQLLDMFKVNDFREMKGRIVYAIREEGWNSKVVGIEIPEFDGGGKFSIAEWKKEWFCEGDNSCKN
jgi:hypothetical protein